VAYHRVHWTWTDCWHPQTRFARFGFVYFYVLCILQNDFLNSQESSVTWSVICRRWWHWK